MAWDGKEHGILYLEYDEHSSVTSDKVLKVLVRDKKKGIVNNDS